MARTVLNLKRQIQEIALNNEEDSPVYKLDMSDSAIDAKSKELYEFYLNNKEVIDRLGTGDELEEDTKIASDFYQKTIESLLGKKAFKEIVAYVKGTKVKDNATCDDILLVLSPLVMYLVNEISDVLAGNREALMEKYLGSANGNNVI